jgi:tetratricopeptide (TPR) repeat protein
MHGSDEALESAGVLDEIAGAAGVVLWQTLRDVTLWAATPPAERGSLFSACAERKRVAAILTASLDPEIEPPLGMLTALVGRPGKVSAERVALACRRIAQWAEKHGHLATALAFAQAGAVSCPGDASAAFKVGQLARRRAEYARAETWFRRAIALGRQEEDWVSYSLGFAGLGTLYMQKGNFPKARVFHTRRLRAARRHGMRIAAAAACHDLCAIAVAAGEFDEAQIFARQAFNHYGPRSPEIPRLAHDVAYMWILQGYFQRALPVLEAVLPHTSSPTVRMVVSANIARAAGAAGSRLSFNRSWENVWDLIEQPSGSSELAAESLLEVSRGALSLGEWDRAETAGMKALEIAENRKEARIILAAEGVLGAIRSDRAAEKCVASPSAVVVDDESADALVEDFLASLEETHAAA